MTPVNLYYEVENAFVLMDSALENARQHATPEGKLLYEHLKDELIGLKDHYRQELLVLHTKNAAPAVGATETAKSDSEKESSFSLDENSEDVKRSRLILEMRDDKKVEATLHIHGPNEHLLRLMSAAVETITYAAPYVMLVPEDLEKAIQEGRDHALDRLAEKAANILFEIVTGKKSRLLRAVEACEDLRFGGEGK